MTQMEVYLFAMGLGNLFVGGYALGLARKLDQQKSGMDQAVAGNLVEIEACIRLTQKSLLELHQIALRQDQRLADQETKIMGAMSQGKDLANLRSEHRQAAEILLEKIREHERKLDALALATLKSGNAKTL